MTDIQTKGGWTDVSSIEGTTLKNGKNNPPPRFYCVTLYKSSHSSYSEYTKSEKQTEGSTWRSWESIASASWLLFSSTSCGKTKTVPFSDLSGIGIIVIMSVSDSSSEQELRASSMISTFPAEVGLSAVARICEEIDDLTKFWKRTSPICV